MSSSVQELRREAEQAETEAREHHRLANVHRRAAKRYWSRWEEIRDLLHSVGIELVVEKDAKPG